MRYQLQVAAAAAAAAGCKQYSVVPSESHIMNGAEQELQQLDVEEGGGGLAGNVLPQDEEDGVGDNHIHPSYHQEGDSDSDGEESSIDGDSGVNGDDGNNNNGNNFDPAIVLQLLPSLFTLTRPPINMGGTSLLSYMPANLRTIIAGMFDLLPRIIQKQVKRFLQTPHPTVTYVTSEIQNAGITERGWAYTLDEIVNGLVPLDVYTVIVQPVVVAARKKSYRNYLTGGISGNPLPSGVSLRDRDNSLQARIGGASGMFSLITQGGNPILLRCGVFTTIGFSHGRFGEFDALLAGENPDQRVLEGALQLAEVRLDERETTLVFDALNPSCLLATCSTINNSNDSLYTTVMGDNSVLVATKIRAAMNTNEGGLRCRAITNDTYAFLIQIYDGTPEQLSVLTESISDQSRDRLVELRNEAGSYDSRATHILCLDSNGDPLSRSSSFIAMIGTDRSASNLIAGDFFGWPKNRANKKRVTLKTIKADMATRQERIDREEIEPLGAFEPLGTHFDFDGSNHDGGWRVTVGLRYVKVISGRTYQELGISMPNLPTYCNKSGCPSPGGQCNH